MKFHKFSNNFILIESLILGILLSFFAYFIINPTFNSLEYNYPIFESIANFYKGSPGLQNDYFSSISSEWNAYYTFTKILYLLPEWSWKYLYASYWLLCIFIYSLAIRIAVSDIKDFKQRNFITISTLLIFLLSSRIEISLFGANVANFGAFIVGDNTLIYDFAQPQMLSSSLVMVFLLSYVFRPAMLETRRGMASAGLLLGICGLFHVHMYILGTSVIVYASLIWRSDAFKNVIIILLISACVSSFNFVPLLIQIISQDDAQGIFSYIDISGYFRHPHHLIPSLFSKPTWLLLMFFVALMFIALSVKTDEPLQTFITNVILPISVFFCLIGYVFVEIYQIQIIGKLQLYRILLLLKFFVVIYIVKQATLTNSKVLHFVFAMIFIASTSIYVFKNIGSDENVKNFESSRILLNIIEQEVPENKSIINFLPKDDKFISSVASIAKRAVFYDNQRFPFGSGYNEWFERYIINLNLQISEIEDIKTFGKLGDQLLAQLTFSEIQSIMDDLKLEYALLGKDVEIPPSILIAQVGERRLINIRDSN